jgi:hypothetical protein
VIALGKGDGVACEERREVGVLEIADPVRHADMAEVDGRRGVAPPQILERKVCEFPIVRGKRKALCRSGLKRR